MLELEQMTVTNLRLLAKEHNIKNVSKLNKRGINCCIKTNNANRKFY